MLIKVKNPLGRNQSTHLSDKPLEAQESHENSPNPRAESTLRSLHSYLDQNNETVKKTNIAHFLFITRTARYYVISTLLLIIKQIRVNECDST